MSIGVLLVDDEGLVRAGLRAIIEAGPDLTVVGEAADGAEVVPLVARLRPDIVLMDVRMPTSDGIQATRNILGAVADPPEILVVTTFENDDYVYAALRVGASGFLLKRPDRTRSCRPSTLSRGRLAVVPGGHPEPGRTTRWR